MHGYKPLVNFQASSLSMCIELEKSIPATVVLRVYVVASTSAIILPPAPPSGVFSARHYRLHSQQRRLVIFLYMLLYTILISRAPTFPSWFHTCTIHVPYTWSTIPPRTSIKTDSIKGYETILDVQCLFRYVCMSHYPPLVGSYHISFLCQGISV